MDIFKNTNKYDCCGCGSCEQSCVKNAIRMTDEGYGFKFPHIDNSVCINCNKCINSCPLSNLSERTIVNCYSAINNNLEFRLKSSSGGIFCELAKYTLKLNGVVFGASFDTDFSVQMKYIMDINDIDSIMRSKYVQADTLNTFNECKKFLDDGVYVMYSGTPCQINGLKTFLHKTYDNLLTVDVACHGVPSQLVWSNYLKKLKNNGEIEKINFKDKRFGWRNPHFCVKYKNGNELIESYRTNEYMKLFLNDKILRKACYKCKFKNDFSKSDITLSDFWGYRDYEDNKGLSGVITQTKKGDSVLTSLKSVMLNKTEYKNFCIKNGGFKNEISLPEDRLSILKNKTQRKLGVVTLTLNKNIGGELQAYALQRFLQKNNIESEIIEKNNPTHLLFVDKYIKRRIVKDSFNEIKEHDYDGFIVGSDQIWRPKYAKAIGYNFLDFTNEWRVKRVAYSVSFGSDVWEYDEKQTEEAMRFVSKFDAISVREDNAIPLCRDNLHAECINTVDPTFLLSRSDYIKLLDDNHIKKYDNGVFAYFLDITDDKKNLINKIKNGLKLRQIDYKRNSVLSWLNCFNSCSCVVTDSYHGCLFSLIFNKPFICIVNEKRGLGRFKSLMNVFKLQNRFFKDCSGVSLSLLQESVNIDEIIKKEREKSIRFLKENIL